MQQADTELLDANAHLCTHDCLVAVWCPARSPGCQRLQQGTGLRSFCGMQTVNAGRAMYVRV